MKKNNFKWKSYELGAIGKFKTSSIDKLIKVNQKKVNLLNYMDVYENKSIDSKIKFQTTSIPEKERDKSNLVVGDVLFTPSSETPEDIAKSSVVTESIKDLYYSYHLTRYRIKNKNLISNEFRKFCFDNNKLRRLYFRLATGSTRFTLNVKNLSKIIIKVPEDIEDQNKISNLLNSFIQLIDFYKSKIKKIDKLKKSLISDFYDINSLFNKKNNFEFKRYKLNEIANIERGKFTHRPRNDPKFYGGDYPFIQTGSVSKDYLFIENFKQTLNKKGFDVSKIFKANTIVMTIAANVGEVGILKFDACFPDSLVGITIKDKGVDKFYLFYALKYLNNNFNKVATESAQKNINLETFKDINLMIPNYETQKKISSILVNLDELLNDLKKKYSNLIFLKESINEQIFKENK